MQKPLEGWDDLPLNPGDRQALQQLMMSVLLKNPDAIGGILGRPLSSPYNAYQALSELPGLPFITAFTNAIRATLSAGQPISLDDIYRRGISRAVVDMRADGFYRGFSLAHMVPGIRVDQFEGSKDVSKRFPPKAMTCVENWMDATYLEGEQKYPHYNRILKKHLPEELESPRVTWSTISVDDELAAVAKYTDDSFFGTHYVDPRYQRGYSFGSIVRSLALGHVPSKTLVRGHVAPHNPALARHFRVDRLAYNNATLGTGLVRERDEQGESEDLLETVIAAKLCGFQSVHESRHSDELVDSWAAGAPLPTDERTQGRLRVYPAEALKGDALIQTLRDNFDDDYILTRRTSKAWLFEDRFLANPFMGGRIYWDFDQRMREVASYGYSAIDSKRSKA